MTSLIRHTHGHYYLSCYQHSCRKSRVKTLSCSHWIVISVCPDEYVIANSELHLVDINPAAITSNGPLHPVPHCPSIRPIILPSSNHFFHHTLFFSRRSRVNCLPFTSLSNDTPFPSSCLQCHTSWPLAPTLLTVVQPSLSPYPIIFIRRSRFACLHFPSLLNDTPVPS